MFVNICGLGPTFRQAPPQSQWGLPWSPVEHRHTVHFEMHDRSLWERRGPEYIEHLRSSTTPIIMQREHDDIPASIAFPLDRAIALGGDYFNSSIAYMLALAALERYDVRIYGVDNDPHGEWINERPCNEYWIGILRGRGQQVWVHPDSHVTRFHPQIDYNGELITYKDRYGWL